MHPSFIHTSHICLLSVAAGVFPFDWSYEVMLKLSTLQWHDIANWPRRADICTFILFFGGMSRKMYS